MHTCENRNKESTRLVITHACLKETVYVHPPMIKLAACTGHSIYRGTKSTSQMALSVRIGYLGTSKSNGVSW